MWQVMHPTSYVTPKPTPFGTFTTAENSTETDTSPLTPFREDSTEFWTSNSARETKTFGYAYPETQPWNFANQSQYQQSVRAAVARLYGSTVPFRMAGVSPPPTGQIPMALSTDDMVEQPEKAAPAEEPATKETENPGDKNAENAVGTPEEGTKLTNSSLSLGSSAQKSMKRIWLTIERAKI
jgi:hypothetical protein